MNVKHERGRRDRKRRGAQAERQPTYERFWRPFAEVLCHIEAAEDDLRKEREAFMNFIHQEWERCLEIRSPNGRSHGPMAQALSNQ
eukprot:symbB.v1.2.038704.t1/scaffold6132.1/size20720/2